MLLDDNFASILSGLSEGRRVFANIQKMVCYLLCVNIFEVMVVVITMVLEMPTGPEEAILLWANLVTHEFYPWAVVSEPADDQMMKLPPRDRKKGIVSKIAWLCLLIPVFFIYAGTLISVQVVASSTFSGTILSDPLVGTANLREWQPGVLPATCLWVKEWDKYDREFKRSKAPITCQMHVPATFFSSKGGPLTKQWGNKNKQSGEALQAKMDKFTGEFGGFFDQVAGCNWKRSNKMEQ